MMKHDMHGDDTEQLDRNRSQRRALLRAAASAPLVATLHSGAAGANASASQCVISGQTASNLTLGGAPPYTVRSPDAWVRRAGQQAKARHSGRSFMVYKINGEWYDQNGVKRDVVFGTPCNQATQVCAGNPSNTYLLEVYEPELQGLAPVGVHPRGPFPLQKIPGRTASAPAENTAITGSCLLSVDPNLFPT